MPGVGAFGASMAKIFKNIPVDCLIEEIIEKGKPFLGICVGMQILADIGLEFGEHIGLGLIPGVVDKVHSDGQQLPHVGWNNIEINKDSPLFANFGEFRDFYFVHSYAYSVANEEHLIAQVEYGSKFTAAICKDNIYGVQFHPEKSQRAGQLLLHNFLSNT
jgi:glutamine amidotransferase